ncbi:MAG: hypothetical protein LCH69_05745 [Proteobacteria bacterium]|nr:hypothetical protein [Pseudomonadota bacterium]
MKHVIVSIVLVAALSSPASAFRAVNGYQVEQTGPQQFQVVYNSSRHETAYLCAAGDFVSRGLGMPSKTRIFRESPAPRKAGQGITFTLDEAKKVPMELFSSFGTKKGDGGISAGTAKSNYCLDMRFLWY